MNVDLPGLFEWLAKEEWPLNDSGMTYLLLSHSSFETTGITALSDKQTDFYLAAPLTLAELAVELVKNQVALEFALGGKSMGYEERTIVVLGKWGIPEHHYRAVVGSLEKVRGR